MSPLPNTSVIPLGWAAHHRPVANSTMTATGVIKRISAGPPPYPLPPGWTTETVLWSGLVRVQELKRENSPVPADQPTQTRQYLITTPTSIPAVRAGEGGDIVEAVGRRFNILQSMAGSLLWETDLICIDNITQQNP